MYSNPQSYVLCMLIKVRLQLRMLREGHYLFIGECGRVSL